MTPPVNSPRGLRSGSPHSPHSPHALKVLEPRRNLGIAALLLLTVLWGSSFVVVKDAVNQVPPGLLLAVRFIVAALGLTPFLRRDWKLWRAGAELGFYLLLGYGSQTVGLLYTTVHRSAFVTSLNVLFLPLLLGLLGHRLGWKIWLAAGLALGGVGLLSSDGTPPNIGDLWTLGTAIAYALYILRLGTFSQRYSSLQGSLSLSAVQLWMTAGGAVAWAWVESPAGLVPGAIAQDLSGLPWGALIYLAIACTTLTTFLQTLGQRWVSPAQSAVLFTLEPVWASVFALLILGETLSTQGLLGAGLILVAMFVTVERSQPA